MNAATALAIGSGLEFLINLWARMENKPEGWKPSREDWEKLDAEVVAATPEARYLLAVARAKHLSPSVGQKTVTQE